MFGSVIAHVHEFNGKQFEKKKWTLILTINTNGLYILSFQHLLLFLNTIDSYCSGTH
jgi:hypothetical protein